MLLKLCTHQTESLPLNANVEDDDDNDGDDLPLDRDRIVGILVTQHARAYGGQLQL